MRYLVALLLLAPLMILAQPASPALADDQCGHFLEGTEVLAAEIEDAAAQGCAINASWITIVDDLTLAGLVFPQTVDFRSSTFLNNTDFRAATFGDAADFSSAEFKGVVNFSAATFEGPPELPSSDLESAVNFNFVVFHEFVSFSQTRFKGQAEFLSTIFIGVTSFSATFDSRALFGFAEFHDDVVFSDTKFTDLAFFRDAQFEANTTFLDTEFDRAEFDGANFAGPVSFVVAALELSFLNAIFSDRASFDTDVGHLGFDGALFGPRQTFSFDSSFEAISAPAGITGVTNLTWSDVKDHLPSRDRAEVLRAWESFFANGDQQTSARQIRTIVTRDELRGKIRLLYLAVVIAVPVFAILYALAFRLPSHDRGRLLALRLLLFSTSVMVPIGGAWAYGWKRQFPIKRVEVRILTSLQSLLGWLLLAAGSALAVIWFTA